MPSPPVGNKKRVACKQRRTLGKCRKLSLTYLSMPSCQCPTEISYN